MKAERDFLAAIADSPNDQTLRNVFADWLEEKGDQRSELIRIEEQAKSLALGSDEYWALKSRRNELRKSCKPKFLKTLNYGQRYKPVFENCPEDALSRWRLIREFTERFFNLELPDVGRDPSDIGEIQLVPREQIPVSVVEWMSYCEDVSGTVADSLLGQGTTVVYSPERDWITLVRYPEGLCWSVARTDFHSADPFVSYYSLNHERDDGEVSDFEIPRHLLLHLTEFAFDYTWSNHFWNSIGVYVPEDQFMQLMAKHGASVGSLGRLKILETPGLTVMWPPIVDHLGAAKSLKVITNDWLNAQNQFERIFDEIDPDTHFELFLECNYLLGHISERNSDFDLALRAYGKVISHNYDYRNARERYEELSHGNDLRGV